jgi:hypothetical protein
VQRRRFLLPAVAAALVVPVGAAAHHSFAAFFDPTTHVTIKGKVTAFAFTNPHGTIALTVPRADGSSRQWRVETNAPVILLRRGWTRTSIKPGETVTIEGWPARDGRPYLRLRRALRADGSVIGVPFTTGDD